MSKQDWGNSFFKELHKQRKASSMTPEEIEKLIAGKSFAYEYDDYVMRPGTADDAELVTKTAEVIPVEDIRTLLSSLSIYDPEKEVVIPKTHYDPPVRVCPICDIAECKAHAPKAAEGDAPSKPAIRLMRFKDLPKGARFKYPNHDSVWVVIEAFGNGLVAEWKGIDLGGFHQSLCSFVDDEWSLESKVQVID